MPLSQDLYELGALQQKQGSEAAENAAPQIPNAEESYQAQLDAIDADRRAADEAVLQRQKLLADELAKATNPYDALKATVQRTRVADPKKLKAQRAISSLYDTLQVLGTFFAMGGAAPNATPPAPQLSPARLEADSIADRLYALQQKYDNGYAERLQALDLKRAAFDADTRSKLAKLGGDAADALMDNAKSHAARSDRAFAEYQRNLRAASDRQDRAERFREQQDRADRRAYIRISNGGTGKKDMQFSADNRTWKFPKEAKNNIYKTADRLAADINKAFTDAAVMHPLPNKDIYKANLDTYYQYLMETILMLPDSYKDNPTLSRAAIAARQQLLDLLNLYHSEPAGYDASPNEDESLFLDDEE